MFFSYLKSWLIPLFITFSALVILTLNLSWLQKDINALFIIGNSLRTKSRQCRSTQFQPSQFIVYLKFKHQSTTFHSHINKMKRKNLKTQNKLTRSSRNIYNPRQSNSCLCLIYKKKNQYYIRKWSQHNKIVL